MRSLYTSYVSKPRQAQAAFLLTNITPTDYTTTFAIPKTEIQASKATKTRPRRDDAVLCSTR